MAWFEGLSSLKGQLSNLAKNVLADEAEDGPSTTPDSISQQRQLVSECDASGSNATSSGDGWNDAFVATDTFVGQDAPSPPRTWSDIPTSPSPAPLPGPSRQASRVDEEGSFLPKGLASLVSLGKGTGVQDQIKVLQAENRALREENESKSRDIRAYTRIITDLESMVAVSQDENSNLSTGMQELDLQHQQAIEQVLNVKEDTQKQYELLQIRYVELESRYQELEKQTNKPKAETRNSGTDPRNNDGHVLVAEELMSELEDRDKDVQIYESEIARLTDLVETLTVGLDKAREALAPIPENSEELELKVSALEGDNSVLREVRTNLETEVAASREQVAQLTRRLHETNAMLKNQENIMIDYNKLTETNAHLEQELTHNRRYLEKLNEDMKRLQDESSATIDNMKKMLDDKNAYIVRLEGGSDSSSQFLRDENAKLNKKVANLVQQTHLLDEQLEKAQKDNDIKDKKLCELVFESNTQKEQYVSDKVQADREFKQLEDELSAQEAAKIQDDALRAAEQENTLVNMKGTIHSLQLELQSYKDNEASLSLGIQSLKKSNKTLQKKGADVSEIHSSVAEKDQSITSLQDKCKQIEEEFSDERKSMENELDSLRNSLSEFQINKDLSRETIVELKKQVEEKEDELFKLNEAYLSKVSQLEADCSAKDEHNAALTSQIDLLTLKIVSTEDQLRAMEVSSKELEAVIAEKTRLEEENKRLNNELELHKMTENQVNVLVSRNKEYAAKVEQEDEKNRALQGENDELRRCLEMKHAESTGYNCEIQRLNNALHAESVKSEKMAADLSQVANSLLQRQIQEKVTAFEQLEADKNKQISALSQEVESLKNQLEYVSHLLKSVERGEGEGQGETPPHQKTCSGGCSETQEEVNRLTAALIKEQTENKIRNNTIDELNERLSKDSTQLTMLKEHLVGLSESHTNDLMTAQSKINELQAKLNDSDDRARSSSTAYTSANIRANQQVESLSQQVKLLTEHKGKMELELSKAEDNYQKQNAAITNLQAVLHQFQKEKQNDIEFETERIRQKLNISNSRNEELLLEVKHLQDQLFETKKGLAAANRLSEQLDLKTEMITSLNSQVCELNDKLKAEEEKVTAAYTNVEGKVDRKLVKNLIVGYVSSPPNSKSQVLKVIAQVLDFNREERVKSGLEPGANVQHQSLSEAFIKFLESESQPQLIVPLSRPNSTPPSRKTSQAGPVTLLMPTEELPSMPQFAVGRNSSGSILNDVLKDRNS